MINKEEIGKLLNDVIFACALRTIDNDQAKFFAESVPQLESLLADETLPKAIADIVLKLVLVSRMDELMNMKLTQVLERVKQ